MELDGKGELPHDTDFIKEVASIRKPTDAIRVIAEATIREAAHERCRGEVKEIAAEATESESVKEAIEKVNEFRDAIQEKANEVAAAATPGGQALTAAMVAKEVAKTVGKEAAKYAVKEITSQAIDATESESLQHIKGKIVETTAAATEKGLDGAASRSGDVLDRIPTESPYPRIRQASASEVDTAKESTAEKETEAEEREHEVVESEGESDIADGESDAVADDTVEKTDEADSASDASEIAADTQLEGNSEVKSSRIDDNGNIFKDENGGLLPNIEYEVNGSKYWTDEQGRIIRSKDHPRLTIENKRDKDAQLDVGGSDRQIGDHGGHVCAKIHGGAAGNENMVAMRETINCGDYSKAENEITRMLKDGKTVEVDNAMIYDDDSVRPSKIEKTYSDGDKTVSWEFDNVEGSTDLIEGLSGEIWEDDLASLKDEIADMQADGNEVSVTSVRREYDSEGNLKSVTVGVTNETTTPREKHYKTFIPKA